MKKIIFFIALVASTNLLNAQVINSSGGATSTSGNQVAGNSSLSNIDTKLTNNATTILQSAGNSSLTTIAVNSSTQATASNQTAGNTSLSTIATNSGSQATASNQTAGNTSLSTIAANSGLQATASGQSTGNTTLTTIATNTGSKTALFGANTPSGALVVLGSTSIVTTNCIRVTLTNVGTSQTTITYLGQTYPLGVGGQIIIPADYDVSKQMYSPIGSLVIDGATSSGGINVVRVFAQ